MSSSKFSSISRRGVLKAAGATIGAAAAASGADAMLGKPQGAPAVVTGSQAGRKYRAYVKFSADLPTIIDLKVREFQGREVIVRTEAAQTCYSSVDQCLIPGTGASAPPTVVGHGGVGIVEAVGPQCTRARVGDRVVISLHPACGSCVNCLHMRSDKCLMLDDRANETPSSDLPDGRSLYSPTGAMAELTIANEEYVIPVFTDLPAADLAMLTCVGGCGLGMAMSQNCPVDVASDVVVFGGGPVGLSALQGAKLKGATQIIVVEPIAYRRELAMKLGATAVVDPNQFNDRKPRPGATGQQERHIDALINHLRDMCKPKTNRILAGGGGVGPNHVIEAVGGDRLKPKEVQGPDPTGVTVLEQCWDLCSSIGTLITCSVGQPDDAVVKIAAHIWADGPKHHWPGTGGGTNDRRDIPRFVRLMEHGQINMKALASKTYPLSQAREAYQAAADRTVVATIVAPNA